MSVISSTWVERDGLLWSPLLERYRVLAGFTTRAQGSMAGSVYPLDDQERNRGALANRLGFDAVARVRQVHGNAVVRLDGPVEPWPEGDALWTDRAGVLLGVAAADCVPILVVDPVSGRIGAAHAGWQGTRLRVVQALVRALVGAGSRASAIIASIGPSIGPCCYTIDAARADLLGASGHGAYLRSGPEGQVAFDLWAANVAQLRDLGVETIEVSRICTLSGGPEHDLWSYRGRDADGRYGTQLGFIGRGGRRSL
ncbi:MAG TPA: polyphenol oxidase family protein [Candidatus Limnocylindria bacterium]|nr:polyphenol oxidase family protein [Candidatus Limnocylindria bacterium]